MVCRKVLGGTYSAAEGGGGPATGLESGRFNTVLIEDAEGVNRCCGREKDPAAD